MNNDELYNELTELPEGYTLYAEDYYFELLELKSNSIYTFSDRYEAVTAAWCMYRGGKP